MGCVIAIAAHYCARGNCFVPQVPECSAQAGSRGAAKNCFVQALERLVRADLPVALLALVQVFVVQVFVELAQA